MFVMSAICRNSLIRSLRSLTISDLRLSNSAIWRSICDILARTSSSLRYSAVFFGSSALVSCFLEESLVAGIILTSNMLFLMSMVMVNSELGL